jgi:hypothetical protein
LFASLEEFGSAHSDHPNLQPCVRSAVSSSRQDEETKHGEVERKRILLWYLCSHTPCLYANLGCKYKETVLESSPQTAPAHFAPLKRRCLSLNASAADASWQLIRIAYSQLCMEQCPTSHALRSNNPYIELANYLTEIK